MRRISTATRVIDKFGAGKDGFTNGDAVSGLPATDLEDVFFDHVQEEIANVVEGAGITLDGANRAQLLAAIQAMFAPVIGSARNVKMLVSAASASGTLTADEITVGTALGGKKFLLANFNKTINLATTGAGGMDTGAAPVSGYVAIYAIYNPATQTSALLAKNATSSVQTEVYSGANMPGGYTASALLAVWPTNGSSQLVQGSAQDRTFSRLFVQVLSSSSTPATFTALSISNAVPPNAKSIAGSMTFNTGATAATSVMYVAGDSNGLNRELVQFTNNGSTTTSWSAPFNIQITTPQTMYWSSTVTAGTTTFSIEVTRYSI